MISTKANAANKQTVKKQPLSLVKPVAETIFPTIELTKLVLSNSVPQQIRRKHYDKAKLADLVGSVTEKGILQPLLLRPLFNGKKEIVGYEIVDGEHRSISAKMAGLREVPYILRVLTDEEVEDLQVHANTQRADLELLDLAEICLHYRDSRNLNDAEIAKHINQPVTEVSILLKIANLPEVVRTAVENKLITEKHAKQIAIYPQSDHETIFELAFNNFGYTSQSVYSLKKFKEQIQQHYLLRLDKAKFDIESSELRSDGLSCLNCKTRTGAQNHLFQGEFREDDSCLNRNCYEGKERKAVELKAKAVVVVNHHVPEIKAKDYLDKVPLLSGSLKKSDEKFPGQTLLATDEYIALRTPNDCQKATAAVFAGGERQGQKVYICMNSSKCPVHQPKVSVPAISTPAKTIQQPVKKYEPVTQTEEELIEKEKNFDRRVFRSVADTVIKRAVENFDYQTTVFDHEEKNHFRFKILCRLWEMQCLDTEQAENIRKILGLSETQLITDRFEKHETYSNCLINLSFDIHSKLLFLILFSEVDETSPSEQEIQILANLFGFDYRLSDAVERLKLCREKDQKLFHDYLIKVERGDAAEIPRAYYDGYQAGAKC